MTGAQPRARAFLDEDHLAVARRQPVSTVMTRHVVAVTPATRVLTAEWMAATHGIHHLVVVDDDLVAGVACTTDLLDARGDEAVATCMKAPAMAVAPATTMGDAATLLRRWAIGCLPVLAGLQLVGIITREDLRRGGLPDEEFDAPACASCSATAHVRIDPEGGEVPFCTDCLDRAHDDYVEVGVVD